jgi:hypothetical protein
MSIVAGPPESQTKIMPVARFSEEAAWASQASQSESDRPKSPAVPIFNRLLR